MQANRLDVGGGLYLAATSVHTYEPSHYVRRRGDGMYTSLRLHAGTCLGEMVGVVMAGELFQRRRLQGLGGYGIVLVGAFSGLLLAFTKLNQRRKKGS